MNATAAKSLQLCPTLYKPIDDRPPGFSVPGILQARILEWVAMASFRGSSRSRSPVLQTDSLPAEPPGKPRNPGGVAYPFSSGSS